MDTQTAKETLVGQIIDNTGTLDATAGELLRRMAQFFGECVADPDFCGLSIDETRAEDGKLTSIKFVPCDLVGGEPCRREGRFRLAEPAQKPIVLAS